MTDTTNTGVPKLPDGFQWDDVTSKPTGGATPTQAAQPSFTRPNLPSGFSWDDQNSSGAGSAPVIQKPQTGDFMRGLKTAAHQLPQLAGGAVAFGGDVLERGSKALGGDGSVGKAVTDYGLDVYKKHEADTQQLSKPSDSFTHVLQNPRELPSFLKYNAGYMGGQALESLAAAGAGALAGSEVPVAGNVAGAVTGLVAKDAVKRMVFKKAAELVAEKGLAREAAEAAAKTAVNRRLGAVAGGAAANFGLNETQELGSIYGDARDQAQQDGRELTGGDLARVGGSSLAAAGVDTLADQLNLGAVTKGIKAPVEQAGKSVLRQRLGAAGKEVAKDAAREAATEAVQTVIERAGAGQSLNDSAALQDIVDSAAAGAVGGAGAGGIASLHTRKNDAAAPVPADGADTQANATPATAVPHPGAAPGSLSEAANVIAANGPLGRVAEAAQVGGLRPNEAGAEVAGVPPVTPAPVPNPLQAALAEYHATAAEADASGIPPDVFIDRLAQKHGASAQGLWNAVTGDGAAAQETAKAPITQPTTEAPAPINVALPWVNPQTGEVGTPTKGQLTQALADHIVQQFDTQGHMRVNAGELADAWGVPKADISRVRNRATQMAGQRVKGAAAALNEPSGNAGQLPTGATDGNERVPGAAPAEPTAAGAAAAAPATEQPTAVGDRGLPDTSQQPDATGEAAVAGTDATGDANAAVAPPAATGETGGAKKEPSSAEKPNHLPGQPEAQGNVVDSAAGRAGGEAARADTPRATGKAPQEEAATPRARVPTPEAAEPAPAVAAAETPPTGGVSASGATTDSPEVAAIKARLQKAVRDGAVLVDGGNRFTGNLHPATAVRDIKIVPGTPTHLVKDGDRYMVVAKETGTFIGAGATQKEAIAQARARSEGPNRSRVMERVAADRASLPSRRATFNAYAGITKAAPAGSASHKVSVSARDAEGLRIKTPDGETNGRSHVDSLIKSGFTKVESHNNGKTMQHALVNAAGERQPIKARQLKYAQEAAASVSGAPVKESLTAGQKRTSELLGANVGDSVRTTGMGAEIQPGSTWKIERIDKDGTLHTSSPGGGTGSFKRGELEREVRKGATFEKVAPVKSAVEAAAVESAAHPDNNLPEPTPAQHSAGNFQMGHVRLHGLDVSIEIPKGGMRRGIDAKGKAWKRELAHHYGYIRRTEAADGEQVDVYLGPHAEDASKPVFVVDQVKPGTKVYDESKVMLGYANGAEARKAYDSNFPKDVKTFGAIRKMSLDEFKTWLKEGDTTKPVAVAPVVNQQMTTESAATPATIKESSNVAANAASKRGGTATNGAKVRVVGGKLEYVPRARETLEAYFKPGDVVPSYGGQDRVISTDFSEPGNPLIRVIAVDKGGNAKPNEPERVHGTMPTTRELVAKLGKPVLAEKAPTTASAAAARAPDMVAAEQPIAAVTTNTKATGTTAPIDDFGERLEGARKFMPPSLKEELGDEQIATQPLSKFWPADAYQSIEDPAAAALAFAARAEVPAKPRLAHKVRRWVEQVKALRSLLTTALDSHSVATMEELASKSGHRLEGFFAKVRLLSQLPREAWGRVERVGEYPTARRMKTDGELKAEGIERVHSPTTGSDYFRIDPKTGERGPRIVAWGEHAAEHDKLFKVVPFSSVTIDGKSHQFDAPSIGPDEVQKVRDLLVGDGAKKAAGLTKEDFEIRSYSKRDETFINRKGDAEKRPLKTFTGADAVVQARAWRDANVPALEAAWEKVKARDNVGKADTRRDMNRERVGENRRAGKDVTTEMFEQALGFRGVQFGNWVGQGKDAKGRQGLLNESYDALLDLSDLLGIPSKAMSLNGSLGLALGARGAGRNSAHFEPSNLVINLTKTKGAGTLAHEWFHALDNYFSRLRGGEVPFAGNQDAYRRDNYITYKPESAWVSKGPRALPPRTSADLRVRLQQSGQWDAAKSLEENAATAGWQRDPAHKQGVRPEVERAFAELVQALNDTPMAARASKLDGSKSGGDGYWHRIIERGARSFENYVISKLALRGQTNDFLANIRDWREWEAAGKNEGRYPYLKPEEEAPVVEAFDKLFDKLETRTSTDGRVALFSVDAAGHQVSGRVASSLDDARKAAADFIGKPIENENGLVPATVSGKTLGKMLSKSAVEKSTSLADHVRAVANVDALYRIGMLDQSEPDARGEPTIAAIHRVVAPMVGANGEVLAVKMTVKETTGANSPNPLYTVETLDVTKPALLAPQGGIEPTPGQNRNVGQAGFSADVTRMLEEFKQRLPLFRQTNDTARTAAPVTAAQEAHTARIKQIATAAMGKWKGDDVPALRVVATPEQLPAAAKVAANGLASTAYKTAAGMYDGRTIWIVASAHKTDQAGIRRILTTMAHEGVGHYGVERIVERELGAGAWTKIESATERLRANPALASPAIREVLASVGSRYRGADAPTFAREFLAVSAERGVKNGLLDRAITAIRSWLRQVMPDLRLSEHELRQLLVQSDQYLRVGESQQQRVQSRAAMAFSRDDQTDTPAFKRFFGDSKVVDATGNPLPVFHGTADDFDAFDPNRSGSATAHMTATLGSFFAEDRNKAQHYAENASHGVPAEERVIDAYLSIQKPYEMGMKEFQAIDSQAESTALREKLQREGFDGIHLKDVGQWVAFEPAQIKSASENRGTFDPGNPNIYFSRDENADPDNPRPQRKFTDAAASIEAIEATLPNLDRGAFQQVKDWISGKARDLEPLALGALQLRHVLELASEDPTLKKPAQEYANIYQRMDGDRNSLTIDGAAKVDSLVKWARKPGVAGWLGKVRPEAKRLFDFMNAVTQLAVDPTNQYERLLMRDDRNEYKPWTKELIKQRVKVLREVALTRSGDDKTRIYDEIKDLRRLPQREKVREQKYPELVRQWNALTPEAKEQFQVMRDHYREQSEALEEATLAHIASLDIPEQNKRAAAALVNRNFSEARVDGVYFPLSRFGDYWISATTKDGEYVFAKYESAAAMKVAEKRLLASGATIEARGRQDNNYRAKDAPSGTFIGDLMGVLKNAPDTVKDEIYQMYLKALPNLSLRKHGIHRKNIAGFTDDVPRAFASSVFHGAHQLSKARYGWQLTNTLEQMRERMESRRTVVSGTEAAHADALIGEINRRHDWILNPTNNALSNKATGVAFTYFLGASPASAIVNLIQVPQIVLPVLGAQHGWGKASAALGRAMRQAIGTGGHIDKLLKGEELDAYRELEKQGTFQRSATHALAGISEGDNLRSSPGYTKVMNAVSWMFHTSEVINREATGMAAFRLARQNGQNFQDALKYADQITNGTHGDYSNANRARYMQGNVQKVVLQFKNYSLAMSWLWGRNFYKAFKGEDVATRVLARRTLTGMLGMTGLFAGVIGMPIFNLLRYGAQALHAVGGDDDEPWDFVTEFRSWLAEHLGETAAAAIADGVVSQLGANVASRVSMSDLWFRDADRQLEGEDAYNNMLQSIAGPLGGLIKNMYVGAQQFSDGHTERGIETMLPTFAKNAVKATRFASQGVNTLSGNPIVADVSAPQALIQAIGFQPTKVAEQQRINNANFNYNQFIENRRQALMNAFAMAQIAGDDDGRSEALGKISAFNQKYPENPIRMSNLHASLRGRARAAAESDHGIRLNKKLAARVRDEVGAMAQE